MSEDRFRLPPSHSQPPPKLDEAASALVLETSANSDSTTTSTPAPQKKAEVAPVPPPVSTVSLQKIFEQIRAANLWIVLGAISLLMTWGGYKLGNHWGSRYGLVIGFFAAVAFNALIFIYGEWRLQSQFIGRELEGQDPWGLLALSRELSAKLKLPRAQLCEISSETPFIFSAGLFHGRLKIFYSTSMLKRFSRDEIRSLFALELIRSAAGQTRLATSAAALANAWLTAMGVLDLIFMVRFLFPSGYRRWCPGLFSLISLPFITLVLRLVIRRRTHFEIDRRAAAELGDSTHLAQALSKLDAYHRTLPMDVNFAEAALFSVFPLAKYRWSRWASVQPEMPTRLHRLIGEYPL